ncbi:MAG: hypothetical protein UV29_C0003G0014 [Candidatus Collierbacteria bacterium GW2011_GWD2_42_50]|nr:MAG: hypothetical protein UV29_C0003G0014 [Candidatus Collierbacteria bacterium GW2011_GWD2_42_50]KKS63362.1 MAG: hypothetical protein UV30_C0003G0013 [Candidatus Collierbacteria bacterium GW2011_GWF1_42_50]
MILGNCDYYQSFVDIANTLFCGYFSLVSILFVLFGVGDGGTYGQGQETVVRQYSFLYI